MGALLRQLAKLPLGVLMYLASMAAWLLNLMPHTGLRWIVRVNLLLAMPHLSAQARESLERACVRSQCMTMLESVKCWGMPPAWSVAQIKTVQGEQDLKDALANPKGMIAVVPHLGAWEMMNAWLNQLGAPVIMYKPADNPQVDAFMLAARARLNATLVPTDERGVRAIFKTLKQGGFTIILPDHVPDSSGGVYAPFFGIETLSSTLVSKLAHKTGCALIGLSCLRRADGSGFDVYCDPLDPQIADADLTTAVTALNKTVEHMILRAPEQYLWGYRRFKNTPSLEGVYRWDEDKIFNAVHSTAQDPSS